MMTVGTAKTLLWVPWTVALISLFISFSVVGDGGMNGVVTGMYIAVIGYILARLFQAELHTSLLRPNNERVEKPKVAKMVKESVPPPIPS